MSRPSSRDAEPSDSAPRFLLVRLSALGDTVHGLPVLYALRQRWPGAHIGWVVEDRHAGVLRQVTAIDQLHIVPRAAWRKHGGMIRGTARLRSELRAQRYDVAIDLQGLSKSGLWAWLSGARRRVGFAGRDSRELNRLFINQAIQPPEQAKHVITRNLALADAVGARTQTVCSDIPPSPQAAAAVDTWWRRVGLGSRVVALSPGAGWATKRWPPVCFGKLADRIVSETGAQALLVWGPGELELIEEAWRATQEDVIVSPATTVPELVETLRRCEAFVSGDTGPLHIAAALGVRCLSLFGASDAARNGPYGADHLTLTYPMPCQPCWKQQCPTQIECLTDLTPDAVWQESLDAGFWDARTP